MEKCFIARQFYIKDEFTRKWTPEEAVFTTYDEAYKFVMSFSDSGENPRYQSEIVSLEVNSFTAWENKEVWYFDHAGSLLFHETPGWRRTEVYARKFKVGDFVFIRAFPYNPFSYRWLDIAGVVVETPAEIDLKKTPSGSIDGNEKDDEDKGEVEYVIYFIASDGYLDHIHIMESGMICLDDSEKHITVEERNKLQRIADHVTGKNKMDEKLFSGIVNGEIRI